jgi:hypothetical protein
MELVERLSRADALELLHRCLDEEDAAVIPGPHFQKALSDEGLTFQDALVVMRSGNIYDEPENDIKSGEWKYRVGGHEPGGKWLGIIFSFKTLDRAFLITVFSVEARRRK